MKTALSLRSIGLVSVCFVGVFFMFGCYDTGQFEAPVETKQSRQTKGLYELEDGKDLKGVHKVKFDELTKKKDDAYQEYGRLKNEQQRINDKIMETDNIKLADDLIPIETKLAQVKEKIKKLEAEQFKTIKEGTQTCFPKDTKIVMWDGTLKPIQSISKGDKVMIYDIANDQIAQSIVNKVFIDTNNHLYTLNDSIQATAYERFLTQDGWKKTGTLSQEDKIFNGNSFVPIHTISKVRKDLQVYNLNIDSTHNFFVSHGNDQEWFLVHNSGGGGGGGGGK